MKKLVLACMAAIGFFPCLTYGGAYDEMRARQSLGKILISSDSRYFVFEWLRPCNWVRSKLKTLDPETNRRDQAWLYRVNLTPESYSRDTSQYLFIPAPRGTYWLGAISPDNRLVSFYELDYDKNVVIVGIWRQADDRVVRFDVPVNDAKNSQSPQWLTADEIVFPSKNGPLFKASFTSGVATVCPECSLTTSPIGLQRGVSRTALVKPAITSGVAGEFPSGSEVVDPVNDRDFRLVQKSADSDIAIYVKDTPEILSLVFTHKWAPKPVIVFSNKRR